MCSPIYTVELRKMPLDHNDKKLQRMHDMERNGALMCAALLMLSMVVMISLMVYWLMIG